MIPELRRVPLPAIWELKSQEDIVKQATEVLRRCKKDVCLDRAVGALTAAGIGDNLGAVVERSPITDKRIKGAMKLSGGGVWHVQPGQFTDDTELALSLAAGIIDSELPFLALMDDPENLQTLGNSVAERYVKWYLSPPFDIGGTTRKAFKAHSNPTYKSVTHQADNKSGNFGFGNGSLMRCTPLGIYGATHVRSFYGFHRLLALGMRDSKMSHPAYWSRFCVAVYSIGVAWLISDTETDIKRRSQNAMGAMRFALKVLGEHLLTSSDGSKTLAKECSGVTASMGLSLAKKWFKKASKMTSLFEVNCNPGKNSANLKFGFMCAIVCLNRCVDFKTAMHDIVCQGGDTDTNAAIAGGMMGALYGVTHIPRDYVQTIIHSNVSSVGMCRPLFYTPGNALIFAEKVYKLGFVTSYGAEVTPSSISCSTEKATKEPKEEGKMEAERSPELGPARKWCPRLMDEIEEEEEDISESEILQTIYKMRGQI